VAASASRPTSRVEKSGMLGRSGWRFGDFEERIGHIMFPANTETFFCLGSSTVKYKQCYVSIAGRYPNRRQRRSGT